MPISETEQEVLDRLVSAEDLEIHIVGWGVVNRPRAMFGDLRFSLAFEMNFTKPEVPMSVYYFDLELRTRSGLLLFKQQYPTMYGGLPISIAAGMVLSLVWDIAIKDMDPKLVKALKPGAVGLTTREGNLHLTPQKQRLYQSVRSGEEKVRKDSKNELDKALKNLKLPK